jgi:hypothetical protein
MINEINYLYHGLLVNNLLLNAIVCAVIGMGTFLLAVHWCSIKNKYARVIKYLLTFTSICFTSNFFMMIFHPVDYGVSFTYATVLKITVVFFSMWLAADFMSYHVSKYSAKSNCTDLS